MRRGTDQEMLQPFISAEETAVVFTQMFGVWSVAVLLAGTL